VQAIKQIRHDSGRVRYRFDDGLNTEIKSGSGPLRSQNGHEAAKFDERVKEHCAPPSFENWPATIVSERFALEKPAVPDRNAFTTGCRSPEKKRETSDVHDRSNL
jgi:hypothetical protein